MGPMGAVAELPRSPQLLEFTRVLLFLRNLPLSTFVTMGKGSPTDQKVPLTGHSHDFRSTSFHFEGLRSRVGF